MAYLLIPILHQLVHQIDYVIGVGGLAQNRIGTGEHDPISAASYDGANCGIKLLLAAEGDRFEATAADLVCLDLSMSKFAIAL